jgi:hypothetical protein
MMRFTYNNQNSHNQSSFNNYGKTGRQSLNQITKSVPVTVQPQNNNTVIATTNNMPWGKPIWFLFHTLAQKVKSESFPIVREGLLNIIYSICANLPCPVCSNHAVEYFNKINFNNIKSKEELIQTLYVFHNEVNKKKKFDMFSFTDLEKKYGSAVTKNIILHFMYNFEKKNYNAKTMHNEFHKKNLINTLKVWLNDNFIHFDP